LRHKSFRLAGDRISAQYPPMKEILIYAISGCASLFILGYTVHMFIGGMVSEETEMFAIIAAVLIGAGIMGFLAWDVFRRRNP